MDKNEFIKYCGQCGYASEEDAEKYTEELHKENYDDHDFIELYHRYNHWKDVSNTKGLRQVYGLNGKTTAYNNIAGNSGASQDWNK